MELSGASHVGVNLTREIVLPFGMLLVTSCVAVLNQLGSVIGVVGTYLILLVCFDNIIVHY